MRGKKVPGPIQETKHIQIIDTSELWKINIMEGMYLQNEKLLCVQKHNKKPTNVHNN